MADLELAVKQESSAVAYKNLGIVVLALIIFLGVAFVLPVDLPREPKITLGIVAFAITLWITVPVPMSLTSFAVLTLLMAFKVTPLEKAVSGFSTGAFLLIMAGFMMASGVNSTPLGKRFAYIILSRLGGSPKGILAAILLATQVLAVFIPATTVRCVLLLPPILTILETLQDKGQYKNLEKLLVLGLVMGTNISGVGLLPASISNILTADLISRMAGRNIYYFEWLKLAFPAWMLLTVVTYFLLIKLFPPEIATFSAGEKIKEWLRELGPVQKEEQQCLGILLLTVGLWMTQAWHGWDASIPAMIAVVLMAAPRIGFTSWGELLNINWETVLNFGAIFSLGSVIYSTGLARFMAEHFLQLPYTDWVLSNPLTAAVALTLLTQLYHLLVINPAVTVVTLVPVMIEVANKMGAGPVWFAFVSGIATLYGFILVVETMPNIIGYGTGLFGQRDLARVGIPLSLASALVMGIVDLVWWRMLGLG